MMTKKIAGYAVLTPEEAAAPFFDGAFVAFSGFTPAGAAKAVPRALAKRAADEHKAGKSLRFRVISGASTGRSIDDALAEANAVSWRAPYQSAKGLRTQINGQEAEFVDMHLSHVPQMVSSGALGRIDFAVVEAVDVTVDGRIYLSTSAGATASFLRNAEKIIVELNHHHSQRLCEMHDVVQLPPPPLRDPIPIGKPLDKIGVPFVAVDPARIIGVVETNEPDEMSPFSPSNEDSQRIAEHVVRFLVDEMRAGRIPEQFLPLQAGVGNVANAVIGRLGSDDAIPPFYMYTEVFQDALVDLMLEGRLLGSSACSLTLTEPELQRIYANMDFFGPRIVLRSQDLSNNPEVVRRLGIIAINTALEADIYGCVNSTHVCGTNMVNGIGGSGDFTRNAHLSMLITPSVAKQGAISAIVPMVTHCDHNEHSVQILVTEQGLADLRGLGPAERASKIINSCAHPAYRDYLNRYVEESAMGHIRHDLSRCFELHRNLQQHGRMLPDA